MPRHTHTISKQAADGDMSAAAISLDETSNDATTHDEVRLAMLPCSLSKKRVVLLFSVTCVLHAV
jgi:hypothetical protein